MNECNKKFKQKSGLNKHKLIHLNIKQFICDFNECNKKFKQKSGLNIHKICVHLNEKQFKFYFNIFISFCEYFWNGSEKWNKIEKNANICQNNEDFEIIKTDPVLYCKKCEQYFSSFDIKTGKQRIKEHISSVKHKSDAKNNKKRKSLENLNNIEKNENVLDKNDFNTDLCEAFMAANIPLGKLQNEKLKLFLSKYTGCNVPDESALRKNTLMLFIWKKWRIWRK